MGISYKITDWLPTSVKEVRARGWDELDVILFSGDAYVDHPSFGAAVIGRLLEAEGLRVAIVPQPNWRDDLRDFRKLGKPRLFFGVSLRSFLLDYSILVIIALITFVTNFWSVTYYSLKNFTVITMS